MKIIDKINDKGYIQWIEKFIKQVIQKSKISCEEVVIEDIEYSKYIYLSIDSSEYVIRTWNFHAVKKYEQNHTCAEIVDYTLFKMIDDGDGGSHGEEIYKGSIRIEWKN